MKLIMRNEPNFQKSQMFTTLMKAKDYNKKMKMDTWLKRTQTNPISNSYAILCNQNKAKTNPNLPAYGGQTQPVVSKVEPFIVNLPRQSRRERFVLTFPGNFFKFVDIGSVAQAVEQRTFNA